MQLTLLLGHAMLMFERCYRYSVYERAADLGDIDRGVPLDVQSAPLSSAWNQEMHAGAKCGGRCRPFLQLQLALVAIVCKYLLLAAIVCKYLLIETLHRRGWRCSATSLLRAPTTRNKLSSQSLGWLLAGIFGPLADDRAHREVGRQRDAADVSSVDKKNRRCSEYSAFLQHRREK